MDNMTAVVAYRPVAFFDAILWHDGSVTHNMTGVVAYRPVAFFNAILPHDVQDAVADGVPITPAPGEPCHGQAGKESALGVLARSGL